jgi:hypothetical protein
MDWTGPLVVRNGSRHWSTLCKMLLFPSAFHEEGIAAIQLGGPDTRRMIPRCFDNP